MKKYSVSLIIGSVIGLTLLIVWLHYIDIEKLLSLITQVKISYVIAAGVFYMAAYFVRSIRWNILLRTKQQLSIIQTWMFSLSGNLINYLIPVRAGELAKSLMIKKTTGKSISLTLPTVFIDKFFDTLAIFLVLLIIPFMDVNLSRGLLILIYLLIIVFLIVFGILILSVYSSDLVTRILKYLFFSLPRGLKQRIHDFIDAFVKSLNIFEHHHSIILSALALTVLGILLDGLYFFFIFKAFSIDIGFLVVLFGYTLINLSYALPQPPAQLGSNEWMMIIIFSLGFGITQELAGAVMVFAHVFTAGLIMIMGIISFTHTGFRLKEIVNKEK